MFLGISLKAWVGSIFCMLSLMMVCMLALLPSTTIPTFLLICVTVLLTMLMPVAIIHKGNHTPLKVSVAILFGLFWPIGLPIIVGVGLMNLLPDETPKTEE